LEQGLDRDGSLKGGEEGVDTGGGEGRQEKGKVRGKSGLRVSMRNKEENRT
jgi:hypothetical protein